jgi:PHD/YefM family antitoxin component YafN of YafNO toxin-antitoxin module
MRSLLQYTHFIALEPIVQKHYSNHALTDQCRDFLTRLKTTKAPLVLTLNDVSELVVQSAEGYQELLDRLEYLETVAGIQRGLTELSEGHAVPAIPALEALREKLKQSPTA